MWSPNADFTYGVGAGLGVWFLFECLKCIRSRFQPTIPAPIVIHSTPPPPSNLTIQSDYYDPHVSVRETKIESARGNLRRMSVPNLYPPSAPRMDEPGH